MSENLQITFPPFSLDTVNGSLLRGRSKIPLRPKSVSLLLFFLQHPNRLLTKQELMRAVWADTRVVDAALKVSVAEIRKVLGDNLRHPKFIETVAGKGYRFIGVVKQEQRKLDQTNGGKVIAQNEELHRLKGRLKEMFAWREKMFLLPGAPAIGKIAVMLAFINAILTEDDLWAGYIQFVNQYGIGADSIPLLDGLRRLRQGPDHDLAIEVLGSASQLVQEFCQMILSLMQ